MSDRQGDYGFLINDDIKLHRMYFEEMVEMVGIFVQYRAPLEKNKQYDLHGDLQTKYYDPIKIGCIFQDHPDQKTLKKMGWVSELQEGSSIIHVAYDVPHLEVGGLVTIPSGIDDAEPRTFRIIGMKSIMIYPASIACEIAPEYEDVDELTIHTEYSNSSTNLLVDLEGDD